MNRILVTGLMVVIATCAGLLGGASSLHSEDLDPIVMKRIHAAYVFVHGGSGVLVSADGLILTNHHVIDGEDNLSVRLHDGRTFAATLLGTDPVGDIALLRAASAADLVAVPFASTRDIIPGMPVWALGNPFSLGNADDQPTVTKGVLSTGRLVREDYTDALQTDAPVNPGNSGGPLFDKNGRLLGINGQIRTITGMRVNSGIGLAIAAPQLQAFLPYLLQANGGMVRHAGPPSGLIVEDSEVGPVVRSATAGLVVGDYLLDIDDRPATSKAVVQGLLSAQPWFAAVTAQVRVKRGEQILTVLMPLGRTKVPGRPWLGWTLQERTRGGVTELFVIGIEKDSPAAKCGLTMGQVVHEIHGKPMRSRLDLLRVSAGLEPSDVLDIKVSSGVGEPRLLTLRVGMRPL